MASAARHYYVQRIPLSQFHYFSVFGLGFFFLALKSQYKKKKIPKALTIEVINWLQYQNVGIERVPGWWKGFRTHSMQHSTEAHQAFVLSSPTPVLKLRLGSSSPAAHCRYNGCRGSRPTGTAAQTGSSSRVQQSKSSCSIYQHLPLSQLHFNLLCRRRARCYSLLPRILLPLL